MPNGSPASLRHRRSFWIGLGTLILLTAGWVHSIGQISSVKWFDSRYYIEAAHTNGFLGLIITDFGQPFENYIISSEIDFTFNESSNTKSVMGRLAIKRKWSRDLAIFIPYWLIITLFLLTWLPFLIWRTRTIRKHLSEMPTPPDPPQAHSARNLTGF